jgi:hypothetical protein
MPAVTVDNLLVLPRLATPVGAVGTDRPVQRVIAAHVQLEGAGFAVARPFPGGLSMAQADPFLLLDHAGPMLNAPHETRGAPWHPHRGFETVSYVIDGEVSHHDTNGGGGVIGEGDTQWMTAGAGILHDELPTERIWRQGGALHAVQLWVNLPAALKFTPPRYQAITANQLRLVTTADGGALVRIIAGEVGGFAGPGLTHTPITYLHATIAPGAQLSLPWNPAFSALAYVVTGHGFAGGDRRPITADELVVYGPGDYLTIRAADTQDDDHPGFDVLVLGGLPIGEHIEHYGPFVMNTRRDIEQAIDDFRAGRLGTVPADQLTPRDFS